MRLTKKEWKKLIDDLLPLLKEETAIQNRSDLDSSTKGLLQYYLSNKTK